MESDSALLHLSKDPVLARIIAATPLPKPAFGWDDDVYLALLESIVSQQISVKAADSIFRKFRLLFPDQYPTPTRLIALIESDLRSAGLSGQKCRYLQSVAEFALAPHPDGCPAFARARFDDMTDEEIVQYLLPIKGVGRWTVEMLLMFVLDRPDVFPIDDLVIRQKMIRAYALTDTGKALYQQLRAIADPWRPYRTLACRYLWRGVIGE
jgi:DNA-3-methyladenine glycosylase II